MDILELLKQKEQEFQRVQKELEALRLVVKMLHEDQGTAANSEPVAAVAGAPIAVLSRMESPRKKEGQPPRRSEPVAGQFP